MKNVGTIGHITPPKLKELSSAISIINWRALGTNLPRGESWPEEKEYYIKRALMTDELIDEMREEISKLKCTVNKLRQKKI